MKIVDHIRDFFAPNEDDAQYDNESASAQQPQPRQSSHSASRTGSDSYSGRSSVTDVPPRRPSAESISRPSRPEPDAGMDSQDKFVNIQATAQLQVVLVKPEVYTDAKQIADHLIAKKTVVLNLETASAENKRRIIDFLVGVAYANGGSLKPVANLTYIITPYNVGFIGEDLVNELETNGVIM